MLFEFFSEHRRDEAYEALHSAGYNPTKPEPRAGDGALLDVDALGTEAETSIAGIVISVDAGAERVS